MRSRFSPRRSLLPAYHFQLNRLRRSQHLPVTRITRCLHAAGPYFNGGKSSNSAGGAGGEGNAFLVPGATVAAIFMLGILHARRLYDDKKVEEMKKKGIEIEFAPDAKAAFLRFLPLRSMSRFWGFMTSLSEKWLERRARLCLRHQIPPAPHLRMEATIMSSKEETQARKQRSQFLLQRRGLDMGAERMSCKNSGRNATLMEEVPVWLRPFVYKAWARAFHSNLEEAALPLENYASLQDFFIRKLKEGSRLIDSDPNCLVSPVDGTVLRFGELRGSGAMIEQVKGFSYSAFSLLGANSSLHEVATEDMHQVRSEESLTEESRKRSWWRVSFASPRMRNPISAGPMRGVFYCVLYLRPGDYHRVHSPVDWRVLLRRHFSGHLFPVNERATRTIRNLHIENERVVLEGRWGEGFMALVTVGATNIGSIKLFIEPELRTNKPKWRLLRSEPPDEQIYEPEGVVIKKGEEIAAFNMGSTVVLVFQAPISLSMGKEDPSSEFKFCIRRGDRIKVGEAIGRWGGS